MKNLTIMLLLLALGACARTASTGATPRDRSVITRVEIEDANQINALDLVRAHRPHWLRHRGTTSVSQDNEVVVYIDGVRAGGPAMLADIPTINIERIKHYDARQAQFRFGVGHMQGAIEVVTRRG